jgi:hypothetical protein
MKLININLKIKGVNESLNLTLYKKIYSTPEGIVNHWSTDLDSEYRIEVIIDEKDSGINPAKISRDMRILTTEKEIADQMSSIFFKTKIQYLQNA